MEPKKENEAYLIVLHSYEQKLIRAVDDLNQHIFHPDASTDREALQKWVNHWKQKIKEHTEQNSQTTLI